MVEMMTGLQPSEYYTIYKNLVSYFSSYGPISFQKYLGMLVDARVDDGVFGYMVWSLIDNFEWWSYE